MSTLLYAQLTTKRDSASPGKSMRSDPPGLKAYVDALAALVPSEVLALHAAIIAITTNIDKNGLTTISSPELLTWAFYALVAFSGGIYAFARLVSNVWDRWDWGRVLIPPFAFIGWLMLQRVTAFDAFASHLQISMDGPSRSVIALFLSVILGLIATALAYKADQKQP
jgi:hypothetical protein